MVRCERTHKKTGATNNESRYYLSSREPCEHSPWQWLQLIRGHWGGVEIRNHWRRDALMEEDGSRSRKPNLLVNVALLRNALLASLADHFSQTPGRTSRSSSTPAPLNASPSSAHDPYKTKDPDNDVAPSGALGAKNGPCLQRCRS